MSIVLNFSDLDTSRTYSYADYLMWKFEERVELIKSKIFKMNSAPNMAHQITSSAFARLLLNFFNKIQCQVFIAPFDVRLPKLKGGDKEVITVVQPDLCVISDSTKLDEKSCHGAPDLIVEILGPSTKEKDLSIEFDLYEENGVGEYWIADPINQTVMQYCLENGRFIGKSIKTTNDKLKSELFKELEIEINKIFK